MDSVGGFHSDHLLLLVRGPFVEEQDAAGESEDAEEPEFWAGLRADHDVWAVHLLDDHGAAAVLSGTPRLYGVCCRVGGGAARNWIDSRYAGDRLSGQQSRSAIFADVRNLRFRA